MDKWEILLKNMFFCECVCVCVWKWTSHERENILLRAWILLFNMITNIILLPILLFLIFCMF